MLTEDIINAQECLVGLTDEQKKTITTISENNEDEVIGKRLGEVHRQYDADVLGATGIPRNGDEKTYDYVKRVGGFLKGENERLTNELNASKERNTQLEAEIAKGGDEAQKANHDAVVSELSTTKQQYAELQEKFNDLESSYKGKLNEYKINNEIERAYSQLNFRKDLNEEVKEALKSKVNADIKAKNPIFEVRGDKEVLVYHDADGSPLNNVENKLQPYTTLELLRKSFGSMGLLENRPNTGAGGKEEKPEPNSIVGASTQMEANNIISKMLSDKGLMRGSSEYQAELTRLWNENGVSKLPVK